MRKTRLLWFAFLVVAAHATEERKHTVTKPTEPLSIEDAFLRPVQEPVVRRGKPVGKKNPFVGALVGKSGDKWRGYCSGTLIKPCLVLTARHCKLPETPMAFQLGEDRAKVTGFLELAPPSPDIAFAFVKKMPKGPSAEDFSLSTRPEDSLAETDVSVMGIGGTVTRDKPAGQVTQGDMQIEKKIRAEDEYPGVRFTMKSKSGYDTGDWNALCRGDSGGPVFSADGKKLLGVNSRSISMRLTDTPYCRANIEPGTHSKDLEPCEQSKTLLNADLERDPFCFDSNSGLAWFSPQSDFQFAVNALAELKQKDTGDFQVSHAFCDFLSGKGVSTADFTGALTKVLERLPTVPGEAKGSSKERAEKMVHALHGIGKKFSAWELPKPEEIESVSQRVQKMPEKFQRPFRTVENHTVWTSKPGGEDRQMAHSARHKKTVPLPLSPEACDLYLHSEAASIGDHWKGEDGLEALLSQVKCPD